MKKYSNGVGLLVKKAARLTSMCIDVQVKGMPTRASWSGTDGVEQTLWYGEASHRYFIN